MARRRRGDKIDGWLIIDKPAGITSTQVVGRVRRLMNAAKVGHGGTLDPLATGILPIALGEATKTVSYVMDGEKSYTFRAIWGSATSTDDAEGEVIERSDKRPTAAEITAALPHFIGKIQQVPPQFSAIKIDGKRAYDLARREEDVDLAARPVLVHDYQLVDASDSTYADFAVRCGKGTYIRALVRDLARHLGTVAHVTHLRRTKCGPFTQSHAISLDNLEELRHSAAAFEHLLSVEKALDDIPALTLTEVEARRLSSGQTLSLQTLSDCSSVLALQEHQQMLQPQKNAGNDEGEDMVAALCNNRLVALARITGDIVRPVRVINL